MMPRSWLYVPGDRPDRIGKALASDADAVIVDLEDAVAPSSKSAARAGLSDLPVERQPQLWVRINAGADGDADLAAMPWARVDGVVLAKCESSAWLGHVAAHAPPSTAIAALVESARAVAALADLCGHPRLQVCHLGELDLIADLGGTTDGADDLLGPARVAAVYAAAAAGLPGPVGGVHTRVGDLDGLRTSTTVYRNLGFSGRAVIHPSHCAIVNDVFTPTDAERQWAHAVIATLEGGTGVARDSSGSMVDEAVARRARRILET
jgi:citrate lyase subunit beta / citryl-CoA lyase